jgi:coenzyme F420-reducing hydrogenase gamma subunit
MSKPKPTVAVFKFSSCDGCQLSLLNMEDELLDLAGAVDIAMFLEATRIARPGPYDIALVEGSVTTEHEVTRIAEIRQQSKTLIALGTCATAGGIQALRNFMDAGSLATDVYAHPEYLSYLETSKPLSDYVKTDMQLWGCPVNKGQVLEVITALLAGRKPNLPAHSVCIDCKRRGTSCVLVDSGTPCMGPVTQSGCGAICPALRRGCYGCFGPAGNTNPESLASVLQGTESHPGETAQLFRGISGYAPIFSKAAETVLANSKDAK